MLSITPINNNYYNRPVSFKAKPQETNFETETPKTYSYEELSEMMKALVITDIVEQEIIQPSKENTNMTAMETANSSKPASTKLKGLEILPVNEYGETELHYICWDGDLANFFKFIKKHPNFDPNQRTKKYQSYIQILLLSKKKDYKDILNIIAANKNLDLNILDVAGYNDLHNLCYYGEFYAVKTFIENHPDFNPNQLPKYGKSYLDIAKWQGRSSIVDYLTKYIQKNKPKALA